MWNKIIQDKKITTVLIILNLLLLNWVSYGLYLRFDVSRDGRLRMTESTRKVVKEIPDLLKVEAFISDDLPDQLIQPMKFSRDFLQEYANLNSRKIELRISDPDKNEEARNRANELGVKPATIEMIDRQKGEGGVKRPYLSAVVIYGDEKKVIANIVDTGEMEYQLTSAIHRFIRPNERKVGLLVNSGNFNVSDENNPFGSFGYLNESIEPTYGNLVSVNLKSGDVPADVSVLIIPDLAGIEEMDQYRIDQFIMKGGNVILSASGMQVNFQNSMAFPVRRELADFFKHYGVEIGGNMVMEPRQHLPLVRRVNMFEAMEYPYPAWAVIPSGQMDPSSIITKDIKAIFMPYASSIKIHNPGKPAGAQDGKNQNPPPVYPSYTAQILARSSLESYVQDNMVYIVPEAMSQPKDEKEKRATGSENLAVLLKGKWQSYFAGRDLPKDLPADVKKEFLQASINASSILAVSSSYAFTDFGIQRSQGINLSFIHSSVDVLNGMNELLELRKKNQAAPQMKSMDNAEKNIFTILNIGFPFFIIISIFIWIYLKKRALSGEFSFKIPGNIFSRKNTETEIKEQKGEDHA